MNASHGAKSNTHSRDHQRLRIQLRGKIYNMRPADTCNVLSSFVEVNLNRNCDASILIETFI